MSTNSLRGAIRILENRIHERDMANAADREQIQILSDAIVRIESKKQEASRMRQESRGVTLKGNHTSKTSDRI